MTPSPFSLLQNSVQQNKAFAKRNGPQASSFQGSLECSALSSFGGGRDFGQVSVFLFRMLFQLDVFDELFCRGGMELEEQGNLPVVNGKNPLATP